MPPAVPLRQRRTATSRWAGQILICAPPTARCPADTCSCQQPRHRKDPRYPPARGNRRPPGVISGSAACPRRPKRKDQTTTDIRKDHDWYRRSAIAKVSSVGVSPAHRIGCSARPRPPSGPDRQSHRRQDRREIGLPPGCGCFGAANSLRWIPVSAVTRQLVHLTWQRAGAGWPSIRRSTGSPVYERRYR
jgi:hypothetical protein